MSDWWSQISSPKTSAPPGGALQKDWWKDIAGEQSMSPADPLPQHVEESAAAMAPVSRQAAASLPTGDMDKVKYLASKRFPDLPINQAIDRYFYKNDRLAYKGEDGKAYYEDPAFRLPTSLDNVAQDAKAVAAGSGPALPMIGGTLGGLLAIGEGPIALGTGVAQSAAGGAVGDMARQFLANKITGEEKPLSERALQTGGAAVEQGAAQLLGNSFAKGMNALGSTPTYDIPETTAMRTLAQKFKIPLTPAEETGNRTLLRRQKVLANSTEGENRFTDFYEGRNDQVREAVNSILKDISPVSSPREASALGVEGAQAATARARQSASIRATPDYNKALNPANTVPQQLLDSMTPGNKGVLDYAISQMRADPIYKGHLGELPDNSMVVLDLAKRRIDGMIGVAKTSGDRDRVRLLKSAKDEMTGPMDKMYPEYARARAIYSDEMPAVSNLERGVTGDIAKLENNDVLRAGGIIFGKGSSPEDVRLAREAFRKAGAIDKWDALTRSHLEQVFNEIPDSATGSITNIGGTFRKSVMGNARKRQILEAAMEHRPGVWSDFMDLSKVLDATGRAMKGESITAFAQAGQKELEKEGSGFIPAAIETVELWRTPSRVARYFADLNTSKYATRQAELFTTPEGRQTLRELRRLGPTSAGAVIALSHFLTRGGTAMAGDALEPEKNGPVVPSTSGTGQPR